MDFEKMRFNMVEQQIRPWDVLDFDVLDALMEIPRERFVPERLQGLAYADTELPLDNGAAMLEPKVVARLVQGLQLSKQDKVLEIGTGSGYATALLSALAGEVVTCDTDAAQQQKAQNVLEDLGCPNVIFTQHDGLQAASAYAPFDVVYVGGSVEAVPELLKQQLNAGGRIVAIVGSAPVQRAVLLTQTADGFSEKVLFDTVAAPLDNGASAADCFDFF
ncbi:protein-L-isoaspartate O-methyltransferase family protein [Bergeriella denitrificans]|uniref:Protein-L-isoaspartate O-methyltransferase n=1 Tax=Bergeriella denitrificans TaxID=494 RepID=A0A378UJF6_BERDE|nr:protein-L-isoaspartate O-methyltransferase [Bergeriella denitrificans]STZ77467.1 protein-L-isoaspartate O-methyltransferase [Bergeriella denitrificans]